MRILLTTVRVYCIAACACGSLAADGPHASDTIENPFFAFDNGVGRGKLGPDEQAALLEELGYAGIGYTGTAGLPERLKAFDARGLRVFSLYVAARIGPDGPSYDSGLEAAMARLEGRETVIWLTVQGRAEGSETQAVKVVREIADLAQRAKLRVALYPHVGFHVATVQDAVRLAGEVDRPNVGASFNLCHWLREGDPGGLAKTLERAMPRLFLVSINGADREGGWDRLIQPLDRGEFDVYSLLKQLRRLGYDGPIGLQCYNIREDSRVHLARSMNAWRGLVRRWAEEKKAEGKDE